MRDLLLAVIVFGLLPVCFFRPWVGILVWTWVSTMSPHRLTWGFAQEIPWAALVGGATLVGLLVTRDKKPIPWNAQLVLMAALLAYFTFTTLTAWEPDAAWEKWKLVMKVIVMAILATFVIYGRARIRWLLIVIALSVGYYGIKGGIFSLATGGVHLVHGPDGSFMTRNNGIGVGLLMVVPILLALMREQQPRWQRWGYGVAAGLSTISIIFTYSRGAWLGLVASASFMFMHSRRKFLIALALAPVLFVGILWTPDKLFDRADTIAEYEKDGSAMQRIHTWIVSWNIAVESPITGAGFEFETTSPDRWFRYADPEIYQHQRIVQSAHSIYLQILGDHGFVAFGLWLFLVLSSLWKFNTLAKRTAGDPELEWIGNYAAAIRTSLIGYMVSGAFVSSAYFDLAWVYYTLTAILYRELHERIGTRQELAVSGNGARVRTAPSVPAAGIRRNQLERQ